MRAETDRETASGTAVREIKRASIGTVIQPFVKKHKKSSFITNLSVFLPVWNPFFGMIFENKLQRIDPPQPIDKIPGFGIRAV